MGVWVTVWVVLMMFWILGGCYTTWDQTKPQNVFGYTIIPWAAVLILGLVVFGAVRSLGG